MKNVKQREDFRVLIVYPNLPMMLVPSIAIGLFTWILKREGYQIDLFDTTHYVAEENSSPQNRVKYLQAREFDEGDDLGVKIKTDLLGDFQKKVVAFEPDFMIFSVVEDAFLQAIKMLRAVKALDVPHLVGGVFPTAAPDKCMEFSDIRMIGIGEGEKTIVNVAEAVRKGDSFDNIPGIWFKKENSKIQKNPLEKLVNIDNCLTDFSLFSESRFYRPMGGRTFKTVPVETYRGCPYACTYCNSPMQKRVSRANNIGRFLRRKSFGCLQAELQKLIECHQPEFFYFIDDSFLARSKKTIYEFCQMYKKFNLPFWINTRPEDCNAENLQLLKNVGCYRISFGIECGNEEFRKKALNRKVSNEHLLNQFEIISKSGIAFSVNLIIGFPGETRELIMDTVKLTRSVPAYDTLTVSIFTPYHGTVLRDIAVKNDWLDDKTITKHTTSASLLKMPNPYVSRDEIDGLMRVLPLYCYFPKTDWDQLRRAEIDDEEGNKILHYYSNIYKEKFLKLTQDEKKEILVEGGTGCAINPKDSFRISPSRMTGEQLE